MEVRPGYKQTEVGVIPEEWEVKQIQDVCGFIVPGRNKPRIFDGNIPWITTPDLEDGRIVNESRLSLKVSTSEAKAVGSKVVPAGSVLMSCAGELGIVALAGCDIVINQQLHAFLPSAAINGVFLAYAIKAQASYIDSVATKTAVPYLNKDNCNSIPIPLPTLAEQEAIAAALSDADAFIESLEHLIAKKRLVKQGAMQELLRPKAGWVEQTLGDVALFHKGKGLAKNELDPFERELCIHYGELFTKYPETIKQIYSRTCARAGAFRSMANDVLMPTSDVTPNGLATASCILQDDVILGSDILVIRVPRSYLNGSFLSYMIRLLRDQIMQLVTGTTVYHLYGSDMKKFTFSIPRIEEQDAIVQILEDMDAEITALEEKLTKARQIKQGMMQELLTGRIRLL